MAMVCWQHAALVRRRGVIALERRLWRFGTAPERARWTSLGLLPTRELRAATGYLERVGLGHLAAQRAGTLSGGQAQRVAIARALAQRPSVMLADEPVASLDPEAAKDIMALLRALAHDQGLAVLCVLHQVDLAFDYADRVVGMRDGRVEFDRPRASLSAEAVRRLYLAEAA